MKAVVLTGIKKMELRNVPDPVIKNPGDVKIKMSVAGICGSDIHYYTWGNIGSQVVKYPFTVGHEGSGVIVEAGPEVKHFRPGDKVAIDPAMPCFKCDQCLSGRSHTCRKLKFLGCPEQAEGLLSEYIVIPETSCVKLPGNLTLDHGALSEPLSIGLYSVRKSGDIKGKNIGILGFGPIGMSVMLTARAEGARSVYVTDKIQDRLAVAVKEGATWTGNPLKDDVVSEINKREPLGLDVVFECCGQQEAVDQAVEIMKPGGKIIVVGIPDLENWLIKVDRTRRYENTILFIRRQVDSVEPVIEMMESGRINTKNMVTHRFPLDKTGEAFDFVADYRDGVMKALIDIGH
jgi:L-iditol 2-dehydrogenase